MPTESTLRPSSAPAVATMQLVRRRSFGKVVRIDLVSPAAAQIVSTPVPPDDGSLRRRRPVSHPTR